MGTFTDGIKEDIGDGTEVIGDLTEFIGDIIS